MSPKSSATTRAVRKKYDILARLYDKIYKNYVRRTTDKALVALPLGGNEQILDIGCGTGALEIKLLNRFPDLTIVGVDLSEDMLERARKKLTAHPNVLLKAGDFLQVPLDENRFDAAFSLSNLHYFSDPAAVTRKALTHLKAGGRLVLVDWNRRSLKGRIYNAYMGLFDPGFVKIYTPEEAQSILTTAGFQIERMERFRVGLLWSILLFVCRKPV